MSNRVINPHLDQGRVVWSDEFAGEYNAPSSGYSEEFELQWKLALDGRVGFYEHSGASVEDEHIDDRIYEWTGHYPKDADSFDASSGARPLDHPISTGLIERKKCIDIGCGMGRWTRTMQKIGADSVLSVDMSASALKSVRRFNRNVLEANVMDLIDSYPELEETFDFAVLWGVAQHTHNPMGAFANAAKTVKSGGAIYIMVYAPERVHGTDLANRQRKKFFGLRSVSERLEFVDKVYNREWDSSYALVDNFKNLSRNIRGLSKGSKVGVLDLLEPFYNWVVPLSVIERWMANEGFGQIMLLNEYESSKCAYHVLGIKE
jgi:SAM-dependent methyltransferase